MNGQEVDGTRVNLVEPNCTAGVCNEVAANTAVIPGAYIPQCTEEGQYERVQCHASTGYCWCTHLITNVEEPGTRVRGRPECPELEENAPKTKCQLEREEIASKEQPLIGAYRPQCDQDGSYSPMQCHSSTGHCWCVDIETNEEKSDTRVGPGEETPKCNGAARFCQTGLWTLCLLAFL